MEIRFKLNGIDKIIDTDPSRRLLDFLREEFNLTGAKEGCGEGECGACTIILDGKAVHACLIMTGQIDGSELITIEGLADSGQLDILQESFIKNTAIQCGYCTPGMIMSAKALLMHNPSPSIEEIKEAIAGNICRCSGYAQIISAVSEASDTMVKREADHE